MSTPDRLTRIFLEACAIPPEERLTFLDAACAGDAGLRSEVEAMLAADDRAAAGKGTEGLAAAVGAVAADAARAAQPPALPDQIGPYRILGLLGEGGMGIVYRAAQTEPVRREVALKLVRAAVDSAGAVSRFELERQALAMMDHPNVAHLYDAGTTDDGRPYFVMELVHGVSITEYCKAQDLALRERVELFLGVCRGVRHAHRRGVIHRDLKPSNILITREEAQVVPKVIDFSIAKAIGEPALGTEFRTRTGQVIGTLEYMSPEQAAGTVGAIDTRSDVYAMGVILYELLTDRMPHEIAGTPLHEAVRRIVQEPPRSLRSAGSTTHGRVDDDLATIVGKCLEKEPDRRYGSAADLVEDLERYLSSRPIQARPPSTIYQMRKLVGRHRAIFGSMTIALVLLIAFSITVTYQLGIQRRERQRAENEASKARGINTFLQEMLAAADPARQGGKVSIREVLDKGAEKIDTGLRDQPEVAVELHRTVAHTYSSLGLIEPQRKHLSRALQLAIQAHGEDDPRTAAIRLERSNQLRGEGHYNEAEEEAKRALEIYRSRRPADDLDVASCLSSLAEIAYLTGRLEDSRQLAEEALAMRRRLLGESDPLVAFSLNELGTTLTNLDRLKEGESLLRQAAAILKAAKGDHSVEYVDVLADLAYNLCPQGRTEECVILSQEVLDKRIENLGKDHFMVALSQNNLAQAMLEQSLCSQALIYEQEALRIWRRSFSEEHPNVALAWNNVGFMRQCSGDYAGAEQAYDAAWQIAFKHRDEMVSLIPVLCMNRAIVKGRLGHLEQAERLARQSLDGSGECTGLQPNKVWGWQELGSMLLEEGRSKEAEADLNEALRLLEEAVSRNGGSREQEPRYHLLLNAVGRSQVKQGRIQEGDALLVRARDGLLKSIAAADTRRHELDRTAELYEQLKQPAVAKLYRAALEHLDKLTKGQDAPSIASGG